MKYTDDFHIPVYAAAFLRGCTPPVELWYRSYTHSLDSASVGLTRRAHNAFWSTRQTTQRDYTKRFAMQIIFNCCSLFTWHAVSLVILHEPIEMTENLLIAIYIFLR